MKLLASIYLLCGFAVGKAPHKKEDLEQMNEEQRHDFDKNIMLDTTDDVKLSAAQKDIKLPNILIRSQVTPDWQFYIFLKRVPLSTDDNI